MKENLKRFDTNIKKGLLPAAIAATTLLALGACKGQTVNFTFEGAIPNAATATPRPSEAAGTPTPRPTETPIVIPGPEGKPGQNGESAYQIAVRLGLFNGSEKEWVDSLKGKDGAKGETGAQGPQGPKGDKGDSAAIPTPTPVAPFTEISLAPGQSIVVGPNDVVAGDVSFDRTPWHDDVSTTGMVTSVLRGALLTADFGATVFRVQPGQSKDQVITAAVNGLDQTGCGNQQTGCEIVDQVQFPGTSQRELRRPVQAPIPIPIETPRQNPSVRLPVGTSIDVQLGDIVVGDVGIIDPATGIFRPFYDRLENTGVITRMATGGKIVALENAGDVIRPLPGTNVNELEIEQERLMRAANPKILLVTHQVFPGPLQGDLIPKPIEAPVPIPDRGIPIEFARGETRVVDRAVLSGDFRLGGISGREMHDNRADTAAILMIEGRAAIFSEFGGSGNTNFTTQEGLEDKTREILRQKLTEFREVTVHEIDANGNLISSVTFTRDGFLIDNISAIQADRLVLRDGTVILQDNRRINFDNRREDRRQDRRNP